MIRKAILLLSLLALAGCGYSNQSLLPEHIKTVYVPPVKNAIDLSVEISDRDRFRTYRPGLEVDLTNSIINRFIFDGNLKIAREAGADAIVNAKLIDFRRDPLRYSDNDDVQEYRLSIVVEVEVRDVRNNKVIWRDNHLTGDSTFLLSGSRAISEDQAAAKAVEDVARRVVERTLEVW